MFSSKIKIFEGLVSNVKNNFDDMLSLQNLLWTMIYMFPTRM